MPSSDQSASGATSRHLQRRQQADLLVEGHDQTWSNQAVTSSRFVMTSPFEMA
jgi:hypothetical protein